MFDSGPPHQGGHGQTRVVHEGQRNRHQNPVAADADLTGQRPQTLLGLEPALMAVGQHRGHLGPGVVTGARVLGTRISQSDHQVLDRCPRPRARR